MSKRFAMTRLGLACVAGCLALVGGCQTTTDKQVKTQAQQAHTAMESAVVKDQDVNQYLQSIGDRIVTSARELNQEGYKRDKNHDISKDSWMFGKEMQFVLVNNDRVNAVTTGGNYMYVYNGFLQQCRSEEELAAVMSHEFGHVYMRHIQHKIDSKNNQEMGKVGGNILGQFLARNQDAQTQEQAGQLGNNVAGWIGHELGQGFSQSEEAQADEVGLMFYTRAGWDPAKFVDVFQAQLDKTGGSSHAAAAGGTSDHPPLEERITNTQKNVAKLPPDAANWKKPAVASTLKFRKVKDEATTAIAAMPASSELTSAQTALGAFASCFEDTPPAQKTATPAPNGATTPPAAPGAPPAPAPRQGFVMPGSGK